LIFFKKLTILMKSIETIKTPIIVGIYIRLLCVIIVTLVMLQTLLLFRTT
jgi:hypothetical protein